MKFNTNFTFLPLPLFLRGNFEVNEKNVSFIDNDGYLFQKILVLGSKIEKKETRMLPSHSALNNDSAQFILSKSSILLAALVLRNDIFDSDFLRKRNESLPATFSSFEQKANHNSIFEFGSFMDIDYDLIYWRRLKDKEQKISRINQIACPLNCTDEQLVFTQAFLSYENFTELGFVDESQTILNFS